MLQNVIRLNSNKEVIPVRLKSFFVYQMGIGTYFVGEREAKKQEKGLTRGRADQVTLIHDKPKSNENCEVRTFLNEKKTENC